MCNDNRAALMQDDGAFDGMPQLNSRVVNDARAATWRSWRRKRWISDPLMAQPVTLEDKERLRALLRGFGALDKDLAYRGSPCAPGVVSLPAGCHTGRNGVVSRWISSSASGV